jgi:ATPase subunit of ABC transporter with duplicated ATPase domains
MGVSRLVLALGKFVAEGHNVLVLDEPTNHLDMESQRIVTNALKAYEGTLLVVSHDRAFLDRVCNRLAVFAHGRVGVFAGNFSQAWTSRQLVEFTSAGVQGRFKVRKAFRDWEKDTRFHAGDTITVTGMETQAFRRMLRQAEANGWLEAQ